MSTHFVKPVSLLVWFLLACDSSGVAVSNSPNAPLAVTEARAVMADSLLHDVRDVFLDDASRLWVLSSAAPFVRLFDEQGKLVRSFGIKGGGPGELRSPWVFLTPRPATRGIWIWDAGARHVVRYDEEGEYQGHTSLKVATGSVLMGFDLWNIGEPIRPASVPRGYVVDAYKQVVQTRDLWTGKLVTVDTTGLNPQEILPFANLSDRTPTATHQVFDAVPLWTTCPDGRIAVLNPDSSEIHWFDSHGVLGGSSKIPLPELPVGEADIRRYVSLRAAILAREMNVDTTTQDARRQIEETVGALMAQLPRDAPPVRLRCDPMNRLWIQLFSTVTDARGYGNRWLVLDARAQTIVEFPDRFQPLHFGRHGVAGIQRDELDVETPAVAVYPSALIVPTRGGNGT